MEDDFGHEFQDNEQDEYVEYMSHIGKGKTVLIMTMIVIIRKKIIFQHTTIFETIHQFNKITIKTIPPIHILMKMN